MSTTNTTKPEQLEPPLPPKDEMMESVQCHIEALKQDVKSFIQSNSDKLTNLLTHYQEKIHALRDDVKRLENQLKRYDFRKQPQPQPQIIPDLNVVLIGVASAGKTDCVKQYLTREFEPTRCIYLGVDVYHLPVFTNRGRITINVWSPEGEEQHGNCMDYYKRAQCAIIVFDPKSNITQKNIPSWHRDVTCAVNNIPVILLGIADGNPEEYKRKAQQHTFHMKKNLQKFHISENSNDDFNEIFLSVTQQLMGDNTLRLLEPPVILTSEAGII